MLPQTELFQRRKNFNFLILPTCFVISHWPIHWGYIYIYLLGCIKCAQGHWTLIILPGHPLKTIPVCDPCPDFFLWKQRATECSWVQVFLSHKYRWDVEGVWAQALDWNLDLHCISRCNCFSKILHLIHKIICFEKCSYKINTIRGFFKCVCKETESKSCAELQFLVVSSFERER